MKLGKHIFGVGLMTGISRVFGFIRDMLMAHILPVQLSDIFVTAFKFPNMFRDLLGEGALSAIFIPMYTDSKRDESFAKNVFSWLMVVLLGITIVFELFMPIIVWIAAPGFADIPGKMDLTVVIARIMFFYVIFVCGAAFLSAVLNAFSRFVLAAFMPVTLNIMLIIALLISARVGASPTVLYIMAGTVVLSGIVQCTILLARIRHRHFGLRLVIPRRTPEMKTMFKRFGASIVGNGFYQITAFIGGMVATFQNGAPSWIYYSDRMVQLPFAMIGLAAGTVLMSSISNAISEKNMRSVYIQQNSSIRQSMMFIMPCLVGLFVLAEPIIKILFEHGAWTPQSTHAVALAIMIQVFVLPAMMISQIYSKTLYANKDVKTPVKTSMVSLGVASTIYVGLFWFVGYLAIPIGMVASGYVKNYLLRRACRRQGLIKPDFRTIRAVLVFAILSAILGVGLWFVPVTGIISLGLAICGFGVLYLPIAFLINRKI